MGKKKCCNLKCSLIAVGVVGCVLLIIGAIAVAVFDILFEDILIQEMTIKEGTLMYDTWSVVYTPTYMSYYLYNVTNRDEFLAQKKGQYVKPVMQEIGPYVFKEFYVKDNIEFLTNLDPEEVKFRQTITLVFDEEKSVGKLTDMVTTLNLITASIVPIIDYQLTAAGIDVPWLTLNRLYNDVGAELLFTKSIHDLLFGFEDPLYTRIVEILESVPALENVTIPPTFGLFSTMNDSRGWFDYQVYTGNGGRPDLINVLTKYRNMTELDYWNTDSCNMINGTDGTTTPPFMNKEDKVYFFIDDVCRSLYGTFVEDETVKGIPAWKYSIPAEIFQSPDKNPENACFCPDPDEPLCKHDGAVPIESCMAGAPVMISSPHFLNGDGYYLNFTEGVSDPDPEEHEVSLLYEPNTGQAIKVDKRLQINFALKNYRLIEVLNQIEGTIVFPILWLNESALIGDSDADLMYGLIVGAGEAVLIIQIVLCIVGSILILAPITYFILSRGQNKEDKVHEVKMKESTASVNNVPVYEDENENMEKL